MIRLQNITKTYRMKTGRRLILDNLSVDFVPGVNVGILGRNGAGKSTLMRIIGGAIAPDSGTVERTSRISWPIGFSGCFHGSLTGRENLRFVCRIYKADFGKSPHLWKSLPSWKIFWICRSKPTPPVWPPSWPLV